MEPHKYETLCQRKSNCCNTWIAVRPRSLYLRCVFCVCFMSCFLVAFLAWPILQQNGKSCSSWGSRRPATAALHSLITNQHLWDSQRKLPRMQSFTVFAFHWLPLISPFIRTNNNNKKTCFNSSYHPASEGFPSSGFSGEESGVNGPVFDAVAKKPWLGS